MRVKGKEAVEILRVIADKLDDDVAHKSGYEIIGHGHVRQLAEYVLDNPKFAHWSGAGSPSKHHYGTGRLAEHTLEVVQLALLNNSYFDEDKKIDERKIYLAALYHDFGKIWDYEVTAPLTSPETWGANPHRNLIHHIPRSILELSKAISEKKDLFKEWEDELIHAILAHHGRKEWGSPVTPATRLAWLLHLSDCMSARMDDCYLPRDSKHA